jgi:hypothetical protein|tara:strand:+ start:520 stop:834 length:315 start_codon:yes stop_codon:yes gene_type:complete
MTDIITAIVAINPDAQVSVNGEDYDQITWHDGTAVISKADIEAKQAELQTAYDTKEYQRDRAVAYKEIKEQLDLLYHDMVADKGDKTGEWFKHIKAIKDANPKG